MGGKTKVTLSILLLIIGSTGGCLFFLRGCLSKYDERSMIAPVLYFEKDGKALVFSLVQDEKVTSYRQKGGSISKSVNTSYHIQINDAHTAAKINTRKIKKHSEIRNYPVEILGSADNKAWVFIGEPMAFDPFTLEEYANIAILESKNPVLKGKFPAERRYYEFNQLNKTIIVTATDGLKYHIDSRSLLASPWKKEENGLAKIVKEIEQTIKDKQQEQDEVYRRNRLTTARYMRKEISNKEYTDSNTAFMKRRDAYYQERDSLNSLKSGMEKTSYAQKSRMNVLESFQRGRISFSQMQVDADTFANKWYGLYEEENIENLYRGFNYTSTSSDAARNEWYSAAITIKPKGEDIQIGNPVKSNSGSVFLQGGLLLNPKTALPIHLYTPESFLVVYKDKIGNDGTIIISRVTLDGKALWSFPTTLPEINDWSISNTKLIIAGRNNKELSGNQSNLLLCLDLNTGLGTSYDFFNDRK
jgi:hypothetical protein